MSKGGPGRPRKRLDQIVQDQIIIGLKSGGGVDYVAHAIGIAPQSIYALVKRSEAFRARYDEAMRFRRDTVVKALFLRATRTVNASDTAAIFLLKNWDPENYRDRHEHAIVGLEDLIEQSYKIRAGGGPDH